MEIAALAIAVISLAWHIFNLLPKKTEKIIEPEPPQNSQPFDKPVIGRKRIPKYHDEAWEREKAKKS